MAITNKSRMYASSERGRARIARAWLGSLGLLLLLALPASGLSSAAPQGDEKGPKINALLSSSVVRLGGSIYLEIEVEGADVAQLLARPEGKGLDVSGKTEPDVSQFTYIVRNRQFTRRTLKWTFEVTPQEEGEFTFESVRLRVDGKDYEIDGDELQISAVRDLRGEKVGYFTAESAPTRVFEGEPFTLDLRFGWDSRLEVKIASLLLPWWNRLPGTLQLERDASQRFNTRRLELRVNRQYEVSVEDLGLRKRDGRDFIQLSLARRFMATRPGKLNIPSSSFEFGELIDPGGLGRSAKYERYYALLPAFSIEVLPVPETGRPFDWSGAVGQVEVSRRVDRRDVDVGDAIELSVAWSGAANLEFFDLPDPSRSDAFQGFRLLATDDQYGDGQRSATYHLVPISAEVTEIPPVELVVFDTVQERYTRVATASVPIRVRPLEGAIGLEELEQGELWDVRDLKTQPLADVPPASPGVRRLGVALGLALAGWGLLRRRVRRLHGDPNAPLERRRRRALPKLKRDLARASTARDQADALHAFLAAASKESEEAWVGRDVEAWAAERELDPALFELLASSLRELDREVWAGDDHWMESGRLFDLARRLIGSGLVLMLAVFALGGGARAASSSQDGALEDPAVSAYRSGDYPSASVLWERALEQAVAPAERSRLCFNLGNAAYRQGEVTMAVAWYTASLRLAPRDADAWANLELARAEAGLEPADTGDLTATLWRGLTSFTRPEGEWLALLGIALLVLALLGEALRGGLLWGRLAWTTAGLALLLSLPLARHLVIDTEADAMIVASTGAQGRSEPRPDAKRLERLAQGLEVTVVDHVPGWVRVQSAAERRLWVSEASVMSLHR